MRYPIILGTGTHYWVWNTRDAAGAPITLAGTPVLRASINGGDWVDAGLTLSVDHDYNGASQVTGAHRIALDIDDVTLALSDGDTVDVMLTGAPPTVDGVSRNGEALWRVVALAGGLTTAEIEDVETAVEDADLTTSQIDLVDAPNATAITAIQAGLAVPADVLAGIATALFDDDADAQAAFQALSALAIAGTVGAGTSTSTRIVASDVTGLGNDRLIGRPLTFSSGTLAGTTVKITDYVSATGLIDFTLITDAAAPAAPSENDTFVIH
jgi:hypothetical protein